MTPGSQYVRTERGSGGSLKSLAVVAWLCCAALPVSGVTGQPNSSASLNERAHDYYRSRWGIDELSVRVVSSGELLRLSYRIVDPGKAQILNDKRATPYIVDGKTQSLLQIPNMEKVGQLRQTATPEAGRAYWMVFSNRRKSVRAGDRVDVVIGTFRANGLVVE
jgi:hypothetical protein